MVASVGAGHLLAEHLGPPLGARVAVGERGHERPLEAEQPVEGDAVDPCALARGREADEQRQLARPRAKGFVGERGVVGRQDVVRHVRGGRSLHEEARPERRDLLGEALVVEQHLRHGDGVAVGHVHGPRQASDQRGVRRVEGRVGRDDPPDESGALGQQPETERPAPVLHEERHVAEAGGVGELGHPADVPPHGVGGAGQRLVRAAEADQVGRDDAQAVLHQSGDHGAVQVGPGGLAVQHEHRLGAGRALVDVVQAEPVGQRDVVRGEGIARQVGEALVGRAHQLHRLSVAHRPALAPKCPG